MPPMRGSSVSGVAEANKEKPLRLWMYVIIVVGLAARMTVATYGSNYDMDPTGWSRASWIMGEMFTPRRPGIITVRSGFTSFTP